MIPGEQNLRNFPAAELSGPRVLRRFQEPVAEAIISGRLLIAQRPGKQTNDCINKNYRSNRAVSKHIIADRNLKIDQMFDHAVIDSFVMAGNDDQMRFPG